jgi:hypothetical protein
MMTTKKRKLHSGRQAGWLKGVLFSGSVIATLAGTRLLGAQEMAAPVPAGSGQETTVVVPSAQKSRFPLPPDYRGVEVKLEAIPQVVQPEIAPVARTRSSR